MISKTEDLYKMEMHELKTFKVPGYTKSVPVIRVRDGWIYYIFEHAVYVPDLSSEYYIKEGVDE